MWKAAGHFREQGLLSYALLTSWCLTAVRQADPTSSTPDGVHVHVGVKLPRAQGLARGHVASDALGGGAVGSRHGGGRQAVVRVLVLLVGGLLALILRPLRTAHDMDAQQQAVVHDLQLDQKLQERDAEQRFHRGCAGNMVF